MSQELKTQIENDSINARSIDTPEVDDHESDDPMVFMRYVMWIAGGLGAFIFAIFLVGVGLALLASPDATAERIGVIRDVFIIILALEFILIIIALVVLILQVARLIVTLQNEVKPILRDTQDTVDTAKGTAQFVGKNVARPIINSRSFLAGAWVFVREIGGIRRAIRRESPPPQEVRDDK